MNKYILVIKIFSLILYFQYPLSAQSEIAFFKHLTVEQGLSNNWAKAIAKDKEGFMWFGTFNGLNRFDGQVFKTFSNTNYTGLQDNFIQSLAVDSADNIWVGTFSGGLSRFDKKTETFQNFRHQPTNITSINSNRINTLKLDKKNQLWIGTDKGLDLLLANTNSFQHFRHDAKDATSITKGGVLALLEDSKGNIWVGTENGLNVYYAKQKKFKRYQKETTSLNDNRVRSLYEDKYGNIWVGTSNGTLAKLDLEKDDFTIFTLKNKQQEITKDAILDMNGDGEQQIYIATEGQGLFIFNISTNRFQNFFPNPTKDRTINSNSIHALFFDDDNATLWVGTYNGGLNYFSKWDKPFQLYKAKIQGLNNNYINAFTEDKQGNWWIGTDGGGLNFYNTSTRTYRYFTNKSHQIQNNAVLSLLCDSDNNIWVGSFNGGLDVLKNGHSTFIHYTHDPNDKTSLSGEHISSIYEDKRGNIWVGTMDNGLNLFDKSTNSFIHFKHDPNDSKSIIDNFIYGVLEDRRGRILVQTGKGLEIFNIENQSFSRFNTNFDIDFNVPVSLVEDSQGNLWIGTQENGVFRIDRTEQAIKHYSTKNGLLSNAIAALLEDDFGNLWISTAKGLCKLEEGVSKPEKVDIKQYTAKDGLQGSEFKRQAVRKLRNGYLVFGGQSGFNVFNPIQVKDNPFIPPVVMTDFKLFNQSVNLKESDILNTTISKTKRITLTHQQSVFTFEFAALNYSLPEKNQYAYILEGFEEKWNYVGTKNTATYTNLDAGKYIFRVKASNNDGIWNEKGTTLELIVLPPWWEDNRYRVPIFILIGVLLFTYYKYRTYQYRQNQKFLERQVEIRTADLQAANNIVKERQQEILKQNKILSQNNQELAQKAAEIRKMSEKIEDLSETRIRFFTNISHELRTPLNLILWPLEELLKGKSMSTKQLQQKYQLMHNNAGKLIRLINQLLDFRKIETGTSQLKLEQKDIIKTIRKIMNRFDEWATRKAIHFSLSTDLSTFSLYFDEDKLDKILSNLLSNAFKFANKNGQVLVDIRLSKNNIMGELLELKVQDNGQGIPKSKQSMIFNRFFEGDNKEYTGTGIGLSLTKELVELHSGKISVESELGKGATFIIQIPTTLQPTEILPLVIQQSETKSIEVIENESINQHHLTVLLVEDNLDIISFMQQELSKYYQIEVAHNGQEGLEKAIDTSPDLIISDVMMPKMNGFEMCEQLKTDERTSHIPIILVTARSGEMSELEGLQIGANDYISKPYSFELLQLKIKNILHTQEQLKSQFANGSTSTIAKLNINSLDKAFLQKAAFAVQANLNNPAFSTEDFSRYFDISRRHVLRKIRSLTGLTINEYIRVTRLKEARQLLQQGDLNVSEVAYSVGFTDPKYFSSCFKKQFGQSPSTFLS